jgi:colicin import membrane protein
MAERRADRWISIVQSVLLHAALVGAAVYGWWQFHPAPPPMPHMLAIEASVVSGRTLAARPAPPAPVKPQPAPQPPPQQPAPQPQPEPDNAGPPAPSAEELAARAKAAQEAQEKIQREADQKRAVQAAADEKRKADEQQAAQEAEKKRQEEQAEEKRKAEEKRQAEERRKADEKRLTDQKRQQQEAQDRAQMEQGLKSDLAAEEHQIAARSGELANWEAQIQARIQRAWLKPPSARSGIDCIVYVTQVPGGEVTNVRLGQCNGDAAVRESIQAAAYRASPLPPPPDPALFQRDLEIQFKPVD